MGATNPPTRAFRRWLVKPLYSPIMLVGVAMLVPALNEASRTHWGAAIVGCAMAGVVFAAQWLISRSLS